MIDWKSRHCNTFAFVYNLLCRLLCYCLNEESRERALFPWWWLVVDCLVSKLDRNTVSNIKCSLNLYSFCIFKLYQVNKNPSVLKVWRYVLTKCMFSRSTLRMMQHPHLAGFNNLPSKRNFVHCRNMIKKWKAVPGACCPEKMHPTFLFSLQFLIYICVTTVMGNLIL